MESSESRCIDNYGDDLEPDIFYTSENIPGPGCNLDEFETQICLQCSCFSGNCDEDCNCLCIKQFNVSYELVESVSGQITVLSWEKLNIGSDYSKSIFECNDLCSCSVDNCLNRLVQFGPRKCLTMKKDSLKGYGLFTSKCIYKGEFICEYAGEVISKEEAKLRFQSNLKLNKMNYIFVLREICRDKTIETIVDPSQIGNIGRFINHSCNPNSAVVPVRVNSLTPKLAIFALSDIQADEEITMSYSTLASDTDLCFALHHNIALKQCHCAEANCQMYLPCDFNL